MHFDVQGNLIIGSHEASVSRARLKLVMLPSAQTGHKTGVPGVPALTPNLIEPHVEANQGGGQPLRKDQVWPMGQKPKADKKARGK